MQNAVPEGFAARTAGVPPFHEDVSAVSVPPSGGQCPEEAEGGGGERGIRTLETVSRLHTFQACAFDHSAISPSARAAPSRPDKTISQGFSQGPRPERARSSGDV
jgi:hypothetical protein